MLPLSQNTNRSCYAPARYRVRENAKILETLSEEHELTEIYTRPNFPPANVNSLLTVE